MMNEYKTKQQKRKFYDSSEWKRIREQVKKRDNYECQECKRNGSVRMDTNEYSKSAKRKKIQLVVHHIKELEHHPELALEKIISKQSVWIVIIKNMVEHSERNRINGKTMKSGKMIR